MTSLPQVDPPAPKAEKPAAEEAGESWEDKADMSSAATTPDDEENSMEDDSGKIKSLESIKNCNH